MKNGLLLPKFTAFNETQSILYEKFSNYLFIGYTHVVTRNLQPGLQPAFLHADAHAYHVGQGVLPHVLLNPQHIRTWFGEPVGPFHQHFIII